MFYLCNILPVLMTQQPFQTSLQNERETIFTHPSVFYSAHQLHNEHQPAAAPNFCSLDVVWSSESGQSHSSVLGSQRPLVSLTLHCFVGQVEISVKIFDSMIPVSTPCPVLSCGCSLLCSSPATLLANVELCFSCC